VSRLTIRARHAKIARDAKPLPTQQAAGAMATNTYPRFEGWS
jgi:hypothetical protein